MAFNTRPVCTRSPGADCATLFAEPFRHDLTASTGIVGGGCAAYGIYLARDGWIAVATGVTVPHRSRACTARGRPELRRAAHAPPGESGIRVAELGRGARPPSCPEHA